MKKLLLTLSLLLSLGLTFSAVAAQSDGVQAPDIDETELAADVEGLVSIYSRAYTPELDIDALLASPESDVAESSTMSMISIQGLTFDSEENAQNYMETVRVELEEVLTDNPELADSAEIAELEGFDVDGLHISMDMGEYGANTDIIFADGSHIFQLSIMDVDTETTDSVASDFIEYILDAEIENEEVSFNEDGTSTGGVFDRMPPAGHELTGELTGAMDFEFFVAEE